MSQSKSGSNNSMYGLKQSKDVVENRVKNNRRKIKRCDGKIYFSLREAAEDLDVPYQGISQSLRKGYRVSGWRFYYEER